MLFESRMLKMKKIYFSISIYYNLSSNSNFNLKFCVVLSNAIEKSHAKNEKNYAPKPVGRIDPSRLERVKHRRFWCKATYHKRCRRHLLNLLSLLRRALVLICTINMVVYFTLSRNIIHEFAAV